MVYCTKCGTKNNPTEEYCTKCGAPLERSTKKNWEKQLEQGAEEFGRRAEQWGQDFGKRAEEECFGLVKNGAIIGVVLGIIIILAGILLLAGFQLLRFLWATAIVVIGLIILYGALKILTKKQ
jgi:uncharacterized membrane protein YvbJ